MATNIAEAPPAVVPDRARYDGSTLRAAIALLAPLAMSLVALAVHRCVPDKQEEPLNWLASLPDWKHPYPIVLVAIGVGSLLASIVHAGIRPLRSWIRFYAPLLVILPIWLLIWEYTTVKRDWLKLPFFPGPDEVFGAMIEDREMLAESAWHSLLLLMGGYVAGVISGVITGVVIGWFSTIRYWAMPTIKFWGPIPSITLIPLAFTLWTDSYYCGVLLIGYSVWFPVTLLTSSGIANVRLSYLDVARTLGASEAFLIFRVAIPAAMPNIFIGMFMGMAISFLSLIAAETVGVKAGLGWYMNWQRGYMEYAKVYATLIISAVFFSTILSALFKLRDWVLAWQKGVIKW